MCVCLCVWRKLGFTRPVIDHYISASRRMIITRAVFYNISTCMRPLQVLPLQLEMKKPNRFASTMGVLNVGMTIVTFIILTMGFVGFWRFGDDVKGSLTLNLPPTLM